MKKYEVDLDFTMRLIDVAEENGIYTDIYEGVLMDNVIIRDAERIKIKGIRRAKHIIILVEYVNEWSSRLVLSVTDSDKKVDKIEAELQEMQVN